MKKVIGRFILPLVISASVILWPLLVLAAERNIIILHTNDIHCGIEDNIGMAALSYYKKALSDDAYVLLVDSGDAIQGAPIGKLSEGSAIIKVMNAAEYDFAVPGNHEFDYGMERFLQISQQLSCGYYSANLLDLDTGKLVLPPYKIFDIAGIKIAFLGATTPETLVSSTPTYFQDDNGKFIYGFHESADGRRLYRQLQKYIDEAKAQGAEYVILVGHLGVNGSLPQYSSEAVIHNTTGLTAVLDGHSHEQIAGRSVTDKNGNAVILGQTGTKMQNIGQLNISVDGRISYNLIKNIVSADDDIKKLIESENAVYKPLLQESIGRAMVPLYVNDPVTGVRMVRSRECSMGDFVADAYRAVLKTDAAIVNGGGLRNDFQKGIFNYNDVLKVLPFGNMCTVLEVTGQQLVDALELGAADYPQESGAFLQVAGISYTIDSGIPSSVLKDAKGNFIGVNGRYRVRNVMVAGKPVKFDQKYILGGTSYILKSGGNGMSMFKEARILQDAVISESDAVIEYVQNHLNAVIDRQYADPHGNGRIIIK